MPFEFSRLYADCLDLGQELAAGSSAHASFVLESSDLSVACIPDNLFQVSDCKTLGLIGFRVRKLPVEAVQAHKIKGQEGGCTVVLVGNVPMQSLFSVIEGTEGGTAGARIRRFLHVLQDIPISVILQAWCYPSHRLRH